LAALEAVLSGEPWFAPEAAAPMSGLTPRQMLILQRIAQGCTNKLIARELAISERTIKYHLTEVFSRLGASSRAEAVARATALGWLVLARPVH
jgi:DNA-binding NarL/FixJ family response regulator